MKTMIHCEPFSQRKEEEGEEMALNWLIELEEEALPGSLMRAWHGLTVGSLSPERTECRRHHLSEEIQGDFPEGSLTFLSYDVLMKV